jgi:exoribonuclease-2
MYFYKKGKGRYRAAPADALKAALASVERKRQQALLQARYMEQLGRFQLPEEFIPRLNELLYNPDRNTLEVKALEQAASAAGLSTAHLLEKCGAIPSSRDYHLNRFLPPALPQGMGFPLGRCRPAAASRPYSSRPPRRSASTISPRSNT